MRVFKWLGIRLVNMAAVSLLTCIAVILMLGITQLLIWGLFGHHVEGIVENVFTQAGFAVKFHTAAVVMGLFPLLFSLFWDRPCWERGCFKR